MTYEPCLCGATDCPFCGPMQGYRLPEADEVEYQEEEE